MATRPTFLFCLGLLLLPRSAAGGDDEAAQTAAWGEWQRGVRCRVTVPREIEQGLPLAARIEFEADPNGLEPGARQLNSILPDAFLTLALTSTKTGRTTEIRPYDPTAGLPFSFTGAEALPANLDGTPIEPFESRFPLATAFVRLRPGFYEARIRYSYPGPGELWPAPTAERETPGFWRGTVESATFPLRILEETPRTQTLLLPRRLRMAKGLRVVFAKEDAEEVELPAPNGHFTLARTSRDGWPFLLAGPPVPDGPDPIDSWAGHPGDLRVSYEIVIRQTPWRPDHGWRPTSRGGTTFTVWRRTFDLAFTAEEIDALREAGKKRPPGVWDEERLPPGARRRLGSLALRHPGSVRHVACSPDGRLIAASSVGWSGNCRVRLWEAATGRLVHDLRSDARWLSGVDFSPDGSLLATGGDSRAVLWDVETGKQVRSIPMIPRPEDRNAIGAVASPQSGVTCARFSPDGRHLALGGRCWETFYAGEERITIDRRLSLVDVKTGREARHFAGHEHGVIDVAFSPDGTLLAAADPRSLRIWEVRTGKPRYSLTTVYQPRSVRFSPDGKTLLMGAGDCIGVFEAETGKEILLLGGGTRDVAFSGDGKLAAQASWKTIRLWDTATWKVLREFQAHFGQVSSLAFLPGDEILVAGCGHTLRLFDVASGNQVLRPPGHEDAVNEVCFSPDGMTIASGSRDGAVRLWNAASGEMLSLLKAHEEGVNSIAFSPDGATLATAGAGSPTKLWRTATGKVIREVRPRVHGTESLAFSPDGKTLALGARDGNVLFWDITADRQQGVRAPHEGRKTLISHLAYSPDGSLLAVKPGRGTVFLCKPATEEPGRVLAPQGRPANAFAFSPDGASLLCSAAGVNAVILDVESGRVRLALEGYRAPTEGGACAWSSDGKTIATAGGDGSARLWDAATGRVLRTLEGHDGPVLSMAFSPDGSRLATASDDTTILVWKVPDR